MLTYQEKKVKNIVRHLDGMSVTDACDILHLTEKALSGQKSPIDFRAIKNAYAMTASRKNILYTNKDIYCYEYDSCYFLTIYKFKPFLPKWFIGEELIFHVRNRARFLSLKNKNVKGAFAGTPIEGMVQEFLNHHRANQKNPRTGRLLILEAFDDRMPPGATTVLTP